MTTPTFWKYLSVVTWGLSLGTRLPNLKFVPSAVLELLAFNAQKFTRTGDRDHAHFLEIFVRGHVGTVPGNTPAKFEVLTFSRFGTDGQTDQNRPIRNDSVVIMVIAGVRHMTYDIGHRNYIGHRKNAQNDFLVCPMRCARIGQTTIIIIHRFLDTKDRQQ